MPHAWEHRWEQVRRLGKGGIGVTYLVTDKQEPSVTGVLKHLLNNKDKSNRNRMRREVTCLTTLSKECKSVPRVLDDNTDQFDNASAELYVIMEYFEGPTLAEFVSTQGPLDLASSIGFVKSLGETIQVGHVASILHRDIKPDNLIVLNVDQRHLGVVDYGFSFDRADEEQITQANETFRNRFLDLPENNAPGGDMRDRRSDITAIVGILYFCLTGHAPRHLLDQSGHMPHMRQGFSIADRLSGSALKLSERLFNTGFSINIDNRFQNLESLYAQLDRLLNPQSLQNEIDPVKVATILSDNMRARDRSIQISELAPVANAIAEQLQRTFNQLQGKLGLFSVGVLPSGGPKDWPLHDGYDLVTTFPHICFVGRGMEAAKACAHAVIALGSRCVVCRMPGTLHKQKFHASIPVRSETIASYEGSPASVLPIIQDSLSAWLCDQMRGIDAELYPT